jgi:hypothetical protein
MSKPVRLDAEVEQELASAHARYEASVPGLGEDLAEAIGVELARIQEAPGRFPLAPSDSR